MKPTIEINPSKLPGGHYLGDSDGDATYWMRKQEPPPRDDQFPLAFRGFTEDSESNEAETPS